MNNGTALNYTCFPIVNSSLVPEYNDLLLSDSVLKIKNQRDVEDYITRIGTVLQFGKSSFDCEATNDFSQVRYFSSVYLASIVSTQAAFCNNTKSVPMMCKNVVELCSKTFQEFISKNRCFSPSADAVRLRFENYLALVNSGADQATCVAGLHDEQRQCGFLKKADAISYCTSNSADICCTGLEIPRAASSNTSLIIGLSVGGSILVILILLYLWYQRRNHNDSLKNSPESQDTMKVIQDYNPALVDEIKLNVGDIVLVKAKFDDGWGFGINVTTENEGSFPLNCLGNLDGSHGGKKSHSADRVPSIRLSSLTKKNQKVDEDLLYQTVKITSIDDQPSKESKQKEHNALDDDIYKTIKVTKPAVVRDTVYSTIVIPRETSDTSGHHASDEIYNTVKVSNHAPDHSGRSLYNTVKVQNQDSDFYRDTLYGTVRTQIPQKSETKFNTEKVRGEVPKHRRLNDIFSPPNMPMGSAKSHLPPTPDERLGSINSATFEVSPISPIDSLATSMSPISPSSSSSRQGSHVLKQKKALRKFGNDDLRYGTAKMSSSSSSASSRPTVTTTFNQNLK